MTSEEEKKVCGIIMPISGIDSCSDGHWSDVLNILNEAIDDAGFEGNLVSNADDVGIIHKRIIQNLYDNPIVVCDVSCKNPNVMFELGLRLAFDKPTIIIKDDKTSYTFDTSAIEHLEYPRDLRFSKIIEFKAILKEKIKATYNNSINNKDYTTFLKHFGEFKVAKIDQKEVSGQEYIIDELKNLRRSMNRLEGRGLPSKNTPHFLNRNTSDIDICLKDEDAPDLDGIMDMAREHPALQRAEIVEFSPGHYHLNVDVKEGYPISATEGEIVHLIGGKAKPKRPRKRIRTSKNG